MWDPEGPLVSDHPNTGHCDHLGECTRRWRISLSLFNSAFHIKLNKAFLKNMKEWGMPGVFIWLMLLQQNIWDSVIHKEKMVILGSWFRCVFGLLTAGGWLDVWKTGGDQGAGPFVTTYCQLNESILLRIDPGSWERHQSISKAPPPSLPTLSIKCSC